MTQVSRFDAEMFDQHAPYRAAADRYQQFGYRRVGNSGLFLPPLSLGLWYNFGDNRPFGIQREVLRHAFDRGITHFDLANNYGPPAGSAEENFGRMMRTDFCPYRSELVLSTKAGWGNWPGPYGNGGGRKYLLNSLEESLRRLSVDYVDIFYSHRVDADTPIEETIGALATAVQQGKALYAGISSYSAERTERAAVCARDLGVPLIIHQPAYSLLNRWIENGLTEELGRQGMAAIVFTPLAQGLLTDKYLGDAPPERAVNRPSFRESFVSDKVRERLRGLNAIAERRGQSLAQMALAWALQGPQIVSALIGVSTVAQLDENIAALDNLDFSEAELAEIDTFAVESGLNIWERSSEL